MIGSRNRAEVSPAAETTGGKYDPDKVSLCTKVARHLRRKGWVQSIKTELWVDPVTGEHHTFTAAIRLQLHKEHCAYK